MPQIEILIDASAAAELWSSCKQTHTHTMAATHRPHAIYQPVSGENSTHTHTVLQTVWKLHMVLITEAASEVTYIPEKVAFTIIIWKNVMNI